MMLLLKDCMYKSNRDANDEDGDDGVKVKSTNYLLLYWFYQSIWKMNFRI